MYTLPPATILAIGFGVLSVGALIRDFGRFRKRRNAAATEAERTLVRLEQARFRSLAATIVLGCSSMAATLHDFPTLVRLGLYLCTVVAVVAVAVFSWRLGGQLGSS